MANVLIIRLSSIGDVAMTIPVIYAVAHANPHDSFTVVTQSFLIPLFINKPANIVMLGIDTKGREKKLVGFLRFAFGIARQPYDTVLDLHNVIRSRILDLLCRLKGKHVFKLNKIRKERKQLTKRPPKRFSPLRTTIERYADVFRNAGFRFEDTFTPFFATPDDKPAMSLSFFGEKKGRWIGIAPFAKHVGKIYPVDLMEKVVDHVARQPDTTLFFFGNGEYEETILGRWEKKWHNAHCIAGRYNIPLTLELIYRMDLVVCMDSAFMHFAALTGTKVVSVWGATHPFLGFYGYRLNPEFAVQVELPCRPCSDYGKKPCYRNDYACLNQISPEQIIDKINFVWGEK